MDNDPIVDTPTPPEAWYWRYVDKVTSHCPVCAFLRGTLFGAALVGLLWLM